MDLIEKNALASEIEKLLRKKIKNKEFHAAITIEDQGDAFAFSISSLKETSTFRSCSLITGGIGEEANYLAEQFKIPPNTKLKKPIERK